MHQLELEKAQSHLKIADHMTYVTFPLLNNNRLLIKILIEISKAVESTIKSLLYYLAYQKQIKLYKTPEKNLETFKSISPLTTEQTLQILHILHLEKKHKESKLEFVKNNKFVIMINDKYETLTLDLIKKYLNTTKILINQIKTN